MITFSPHAEDEMQKSGISKEDVQACLEHGELAIKQAVAGEVRYGKELQLADKKIIVIYTFKGEETRVITCYPVKRKKWR